MRAELVVVAAVGLLGLLPLLLQAMGTDWDTI